jgi:hypothetical protein
LQAKEQHKHGTWLKWVEKNIKFPQRRVNQYMQIAKLAPGANFEETWAVMHGHAPEENGEAPGDEGAAPEDLC